MVPRGNSYGNEGAPGTWWSGVLGGGRDRQKKGDRDEEKEGTEKG